MSASTSVSTETRSRVSTPPSSPLALSDDHTKTEADVKDEPVEEKIDIDGEEEEDEDMDQKSRALTNLLKTSGVFVAIMADKMKAQQKQQQEKAKREAVKKRTAETKETAAKTSTRRSSRRHADEGKDSEQAQGSDVNAKPLTKQLPSRGKGKRPPPKLTKNGSITDYLKKEDIDLKEDGPTVQEALAEAADEYDEEKGLGAQDLVATEQPSLVTGGKMRNYQLEGLEWLKTLWMNGLCGILADEMGLGKTIQAISMIAFFKEQNISGPFLIAAPLSTVRNWIEEFKFWTPKINTILYHGSKQEREEMRRKRMKMQTQKDFNFPVVVTSYEICMNDKKFLAPYQWRYIIVDEGHRLKNMNCKLIQELMTYQSANRLLITGTPLQNNMSELWSLLHFLLPEVFNDLDSFESWFDFSSVLEDKTEGDTKAQKQRNKLVGKMHAILKPFLLRRMKTDVESNLPPKREYILYAPLTAEQRDLYREIISGTSRHYLEEKAVERIEAKSRTASLKRKANDSSRNTPSKSSKTSRASTPGSVASTRRGRKAARTSYKDVTDREFNAKLRRLENGDDEEDDSLSNSSSISSAEEEELTRSANLALAKKEISQKKLQNPIMQARLACNSPHSFYWPWQPSTIEEETNNSFPEVDESLITASGKLLLLDTLLPRLLKLNHKVLIFSQFKSTLDILETYCSTLRSWSTCRIDGSVAQDDRHAQISAFNDAASDTSIFLLSTRAGGQGINLTAADTVILFDSDWNPQQDLQAMDRAHRIGQRRPVIVYRFATRGTVEETLLLKADGKRKLEKLVIQKGKFKSLFDGVDGRGKGGMLKGDEAEELRGVLVGEEFEKYDLVADGKGKMISEEDLAILTDRSEKAYERAEKGLDVGGEGAVFKVAETREDGLKDFTTKSGMVV
jgi:ATP-dependent DNA helicase